MRLAPEAYETVVVQPGHFQFEGFRAKSLLGADLGYMVIGHPVYCKTTEGPKKLKSQDKTGPVKLSYAVDEVEGILEMSLQFKVGSAVTVDTSLYAIAQVCWKLAHGDYLIGCPHTCNNEGMLARGEVINESTPGNGPEPIDRPKGWKHLKLFRSHKNDLGQIAGLMSTDGLGLVKGEACLHCCICYA